MILSQAAIRQAIEQGSIALSPFDAAMLKEASYTFRLGSTVDLLAPPEQGAIELRRSKPPVKTLQLGEGYVLQPGAFVLGHTLEKLTLSLSIACILSGRGSVAQIGLDVVQSSIFAEPGTDQSLILEITNHGPKPMVLYPEMPIAKGIFLPVK